MSEFVNEKPYTVIYNGTFFGSYSDEDTAIHTGDWLFKRNPRSTVRVLKGQDILMELP